MTNDGRAAAVSEVFFVNIHPGVAVDEGVLINGGHRTGIFDSDTEDAADDQVLTQDDRRRLPDRDTFVRIKIDEVSFDQHIGTSFANVDAIAVGALELADVAA